MAMADMLFVDALKQSGVEYDFDHRRIYPLFKSLGIDLSVYGNASTPEFIEKLRVIVHANYKYCLRGDDSAYKTLIAGLFPSFLLVVSSEMILFLDAKTSDEPLRRFKEKFMPFFVEDFRWTEHNYDNMIHRSEELSRWWTDIAPLRSLDGIKVSIFPNCLFTCFLY
jgi:hypothetical protein